MYGGNPFILQHISCLKLVSQEAVSGYRPVL